MSLLLFRLLLVVESVATRPPYHPMAWQLFSLLRAPGLPGPPIWTAGRDPLHYLLETPSLTSSEFQGSWEPVGGLISLKGCHAAGQEYGQAGYVDKQRL